MPRKARNAVKSKYFHVMVQGIGREFIFEHEDWRGYFLHCMQKGKKEEIKIIAFCVMGNHAHILLKTETIEVLSKFMHEVNSNYSRYYNRINKRAGHVFRNRYRSEPIKSTNQLINCLGYIHNNPIVAGIVERAEDYKWSSYINYLTCKGIIDLDESAKYFDIKPENIRAIMEEKSFNNWMEHHDKEYENKENVFAELIKKYNINTNNLEDSLLLKISEEIHIRCGSSYREIASFLKVGREKLRVLILSKQHSLITKKAL